MAARAPDSVVPPSVSEPPPVSGVGTYTLEGCERSGRELLARGEHAAAVEELKRALLLLGSERGARRVDLYVQLGEANEALGKARVAANNYEKALAMDPSHGRAYERVLRLYRAEGNFTEIDAVQRRRVKSLEAEAERVALWRENAALWLNEARDPARGASALEELLALSPDDREGLRLLAATSRALGRHQRAVEALSRLGGGEALREAAELAEQELGDAGRALELVELGLEADPESAEMLASAERLCEAGAHWARLADLHERLARDGKVRERKFAACMRHASLARDKLGDLARAERALQAGLELDDENALLLRVLAQVQSQRGDHERALASCRAAIELEPRVAAGYHQAFELFGRLGASDGAFNAAAVLEHLGEADINESLLADTHRPEGLLTPQGVLSDEDWSAKLLYPERDEAVQHVVALLTPAAIEARLELLRRAKKLPSLEPEKQQDLQTSTATLVRALLWTTRVLGVGAPALYLDGQVAGEIAPAISAAPSVFASRALGSGMDLRKLAFLWGRGLGAFRPEHFLAVFFTSPSELALLLRAAKVAVSGGKASGEEKPLAALLEKALGAEQKQALRSALDEIQDLSEAAADWTVSYELSCVRAGLLACGDVAEAAALCAQFPFGCATTADDQLDELYEFSVSEAYLKLRARLGVAVR